VRSEDAKAYCHFETLFRSHPDSERKRVSEMVDLRIDKHAKSGYVLWMIYGDGTSDTISWRKCIHPYLSSVKAKLGNALRVAVDEQIQEYRESHKGESCRICGTKSNPTVDHVVPFQELRDRFLSKYPKHPERFGKNGMQQDCFLSEDREFEMAWVEYHRENATLQILCRACNIKQYHLLK
jgi:5-methylcytosine-specific restriction endonuclease McrA